MTALPDRQSPCRIDQEKGPRRHHCSHTHAELVEGYRLAVEDQERRAEAYSHGYPTELGEFYRDVEPRLTFRDWLLGHTDHSRAAWQDAA